MSFRVLFYGIYFASTCFFSPASGQVVIDVVAGLHGTHYDSASRTHYRFFKDSVAILKLGEKSSVTGFNVPGVGELYTNYRPIIIKGEILMVHRAGGMVLKIGPNNIERIDKSFDHRMQSGAVVFAYHDTLFKHGGYGLWSVRHELIYFDFATREWELYKLSPETEPPPGALSHFGSLSDDKLTILFGATLDSRDPLKFYDHQDIWQFSFSTRRWHKLGTLRADYKDRNLAHTCLPFGKMLIHIGSESTFRLIQPESDKAITYKASPVFRQVIRFPDVSMHLTDSQIYFYRGRALHENDKALPELELEFCRMPVNDFLPEKVIDEHLLEQHKSIQNGLIGGIGSVIALTGGFALLYRKRIRSRRKLQLDEKGVGYGKKHIPLSPQEIALIQLLLNSTGEITTNDIMDLTSNPNLDHTQNLRLKNTMIEKLNNSFKELMSIQEEIILTERTESDRRIKRYRIRNEFFTQ